MSDKRLLLIEFFPGAMHRNGGSVFFPFFKGLAQDCGCKTLWLAFGEALAWKKRGSEGWVLLADMPEEDLRTLAIHLDWFRPTHVIASHAISLPARELMAARAMPPKCLEMSFDSPELRRFFKSRLKHADPYGSFLDWMRLKNPALAKRHGDAHPRPDYAALLANRAAWAAQPHIAILPDMACESRRPLAANPYFAGIDKRKIAGHRGCSFCLGADAGAVFPDADMLALTEIQFHGILETAGTGDRNKGIYEFCDIRAFRRFDEVFDIILRLKVPPAVFLFDPRIDNVLKAQRRIERTLPALAKAGHEVRIMSMGVENFSERENARFNKGITLAQVDKLLALVKKWERAYPGVFKPFKGGRAEVELGFILFTPWTTLADIRVNLSCAEACQFAEQGYWLYSTLQIDRRHPIYCLAKNDGRILVRRFPDHGQLYGAFQNEDNVRSLVPWRFKDSKVSDYFAMLVRVCAAVREGKDCPFFRGDPEFLLAAELHIEASAQAKLSPLSIAMVLLEIFDVAQPPYSRTALLRRAIVRATREGHSRMARNRKRTG